MATQKYPFRKRTRQLINQICRQRLLLIRVGRSRVPITHDQCLHLLNEIAPLYSDHQLAKYITRNQETIFMAIPGVNKNAIYKLEQLLAEAQTILQKENIPQK